ncbi:MULTISPECIES: ATP phosphoribosyltransferase [Lactiplantibacillus]|jgi:ATP phosphoribosyltransferase|uniref:ATP phosphoribosyltransferase n=4 Tax=Lactiplantibacillus pentosus TaxID=1589 RepID=A0A241RS23_LACPE|nr:MULTISPECIES: ATP phosphoribosyltransferase [Lactiplantibacillus]EQM53377.1 ATP phosphoribosyltransferase [Lactiplantibacillus plantarum EGD-AQ4]MCH4130511.1 ATP phosphoribosyltransferase [Lactiplantibacillus sp.]CCC18015.1 ATP phosphoribosyltransferase (ATP-PRT) (ATP-PRTase) [Lactiplantibacillus pentosus IG1]BBM22747.1 ATP phosphoribosyltransferase [Lactiplantibacillus plantarum]ASG80746.1 ATP phosphoribosyltransferase [Lactiplantibacillus pentosus]
MTEPRLKIALTKGRVEQQVLPLLEQAGLDCSQVRNKQRRLIFDSKTQPYEFILAKGPDVTTFLERGAADIGIVGSDILTEHESTQYELLDLGVGKCQFVLASTADFDPVAPRRKIIGTKYPLITQRYFDRLGQDVEIIKIEGSVELAPLTGLADAIVDITETGTTIRENHLQIYDYLQPVSTRLVVNRLALKQQQTAIYDLVDRLAAVVAANNPKEFA